MSDEELLEKFARAGVGLGGEDRTRYAARGITVADCDAMLERIAKLEAELADARGTIAAIEFQMRDMGHSNGRTMRAYNRAREYQKRLLDEALKGTDHG